MDQSFLSKINNVVNEMQHQVDTYQDQIDPLVSKLLMIAAINRFSLLLTHIGYLESTLEIVKKTNAALLDQVENLTAENQRLNSIVRYWED